MIRNDFLFTLKSYYPKPILDELLESVFVMDSPQIEDWFSVGEDTFGIIAHFYSEKEAYRYRLELINQILNG